MQLINTLNRRIHGDLPRPQLPFADLQGINFREKRFDMIFGGNRPDEVHVQGAEKGVDGRDIRRGSVRGDANGKGPMHGANRGVDGPINGAKSGVHGLGAFQNGFGNSVAGTTAGQIGSIKVMSNCSCVCVCVCVCACV